ncbi:hypothetical protein AGMMS49546_26820 [Spirochaetia bacterium]|nr:hypothetical protein AGMMS49546_26820 [Spirochaetia bacterium]
MSTDISWDWTTSRLRDASTRALPPTVVLMFLGIKLNIGTSMVASVSIGIVIDYTIHYIEAYKREYRSA